MVLGQFSFSFLLESCSEIDLSSAGDTADGVRCEGYSADGERLVAGVVPTNRDKTYVLLIQSTRRDSWVLPKGGWETDEDCTEAAEREAWEEAGIVCDIDYDLGDIKDSRFEGGKNGKEKDKSKSGKANSGGSEKALYRFYEATVTEEYKEWPEMAKRTRKWMTFGEAEESLKGRPELVEALRRSTVKR